MHKFDWQPWEEVVLTKYFQGIPAGTIGQISGSELDSENKFKRK
jgi:hypothetical protein